jgi:phosphoserine phosphatase
MAEMARSAAFFRVEGSLTARPTALAIAWLAANAQDLGERIARLAGVGLALPWFGADAGLGRRLGWSALRGTSEDRLIVLGEEYAQSWLIDSVPAVGRDLLARAKADGRRIVLVSDNLDVVMRPLADSLGADDLISNRMELRAGRATGRLVDPVVSSLSGTELRMYADRHALDLLACSGYGATAEDGVLLSAVGLPCAVSPDRALRRMAREHHWPVVEP